MLPPAKEKQAQKRRPAKAQNNPQKTRRVPRAEGARFIRRCFRNMDFIGVPNLCNETILKQHPRSSHKQDLLYRSMPLNH